MGVAVADGGLNEAVEVESVGGALGEGVVDDDGEGVGEGEEIGGGVGCLLLSGLRILIGSSPERTDSRDREVQEVLS